MSLSQRTEAKNPVNPLEQIPLEKLTFLGAILFLIGSGISFYVAYQNLKKGNAKEPISEEGIF
ncbi:MAG TPA: hypothetical protein VK072_06080 [Candidatus Avamphibacillus sp.]|nr:hypothetical protein [Candidatus Avamphibacillus sp.]